MYSRHDLNWSAMSKDREPVLSDMELRGFVVNGLPTEFPGTSEFLGRKSPHAMSPEAVRDFYENLITEGKLRVVEECVVREDPEWPGMKHCGCNGRGPITDEIWCPYCGGKLKVKEEVGYTPADSWCSVAICHGCSEACSSIGEKEIDTYCRNCGRKIKRP